MNFFAQGTQGAGAATNPTDSAVAGRQ